MEKGLLIVVSGPAGSGKGTVNALLLATGDFAYSVSATTRAPRPGEVEGVNYYYITRAEFEERLAKGSMLEHTQYAGNYYGTPLPEALEMMASGKNVILEIEVEGAAQVRKKYPEAVLIMLLPPDYATQEARLRGRATETEEKIRERLDRTREEMKCLDLYDYIVYNEDGKSDVCAEDILAIVRAEKLSRRRNLEALERFFANETAAKL